MSDDLQLPPRMTVADGQLLKPNGQPIFLHGVTLGSFPHDQPSDAASIALLGANCCRIMLRWRGMWGTDPDDIAMTDSWDSDAFAFLKLENVEKYLGMCWAASDAGMWVVAGIDSQCGQSGTQDADMVAYCDPKGRYGSRGRNFYTDPSLRRLYTQIVLPAWAAALRPIPRIAMLELHPEPASHRGPEYAAPVALVQAEGMEAIREFDRDTPFLLGSRDGYEVTLVDECIAALKAEYGGELPENLVFTGNTLNQWVCNPERFDNALDKLEKARKETGCAVFQQQLGRKSDNDRTCDLLRQAIAKSRERNIGYAVWEWKQHRSADDGYGLNYPATQEDKVWVAKVDEQTVLAEDWGGEPPPRPAPDVDGPRD